jgi:SAM-dependent methyltransferase
MSGSKIQAAGMVSLSARVRPLLESLKVLPRIATRLRKPTLRSLGLQERGLCHACGAVGDFADKKVLWPALVAHWRLTPEMEAAFNRRESRACATCNSNYRSRQLARALVEIYGEDGDRSLADLLGTERFCALRILGIDMDFLPMLSNSPGYIRSDYITSLIPACGRLDRGLPLDDNSIDIVLVSDTLEHVPRRRRALEEISRVLKPGGRFVTAQPVILGRRSITRCTLDPAGQVKHMLPPSHHLRSADDALVFVEFGIDFLDGIETAGLKPRLYFYNLPADDYAWIAACEKPQC